ncbi:hypothetical protein HU200_020074 [Digitaria exilis]|uniref:NB-ARC domain-containing protein n=1 Tax=Digitaria exilis TaxID=1010633 RepID=A0A835KGR3_9POAL|nr:hypothetical protein HU200_020074 [Digitaria exilis]
MEAAFNTIVEKIISRTITFLVDKFPTPTAQAMEDQSIHSLKQLLLRAHVIVKEAEGRHITNQAMVQQLNILRKEVYRGYYTLDNFRSQDISEEKKAHDHGVSHSFCQSKFNPSKRVFLSSNNNTHGKEELGKAIESLKNIINDMNEFVAFLKNYSPLYRQPYSMHLFLDKCMFARQIEMGRVMRFLVETNSSARSVGVLPIFGPPASGKSTLVSHVCNNERVRDLFSQVIFITEDDLKEQVLHNTKDSCAVIKYQDDASDGNKALLLIIELPKDIDEDKWKDIYTTYVGRIASGSRVIITSRSRKVIDFGTTRALELNYLTREEF